MKIDIILVSYRSEKWLEQCLDSILAADYDKSQLTICLEDNGSGEETVQEIQRLQNKYRGRFGGFAVDLQQKNHGFGGGNNRAARLGQGEYLFFLNVDTRIYPDTLQEIEQGIRSSQDQNIGMWEIRQLPYEHPKLVDALTLETSWVSGACFVMRRELFETIGGFDEAYFMYCEDVDLSWRVRAAGYRLRYLPRAVIDHYSYATPGEIKPLQYVYSIANNLVLRAKFGGEEALREGCELLHAIYGRPEEYPGAKKQLWDTLRSVAPHMKQAKEWHLEHEASCCRENFRFFGFDYEQCREGAFYQTKRCPEGELVSVIVRTCGRPEVLSEALLSLRNQTYRDLQIVVVEDGEACSEQLIRSSFADLNIKYAATGEHVGRCAVGNMAMAMADGLYLNFLDDDDVLYPDHIETLMAEMKAHPGTKMVNASAFATPIRVLSRVPYTYEIEERKTQVNSRFNRLNMLRINLFPIQAVLFEKSVFSELGGFDTELDMLEDWDLWLRYTASHNCVSIPKTTSEYRVPAQDDQREQRQKAFDEAYNHVLKKQAGLSVNWTIGELRRDLGMTSQEGEQKKNPSGKVHRSVPAIQKKQTNPAQMDWQLTCELGWRTVSYCLFQQSLLSRSGREIQAGFKWIDNETVQPRMMISPDMIEPGHNVGQTFTARGSYISSVNFKVATYVGKNRCGLSVSLIDPETGRDVASSQVRRRNVRDLEYTHCVLNAAVEPGKRYLLRIGTDPSVTQTFIALYRTVESSEDDECYAMIDSKKMSWCLDIQVEYREGGANNLRETGREKTQ